MDNRRHSYIFRTPHGEVYGKCMKLGGCDELDHEDKENNNGVELSKKVVRERKKAGNLIIKGNSGHLWKS